MYDKGKLIAVIDEGTKITRVVVSTKFVVGFYLNVFLSRWNDFNDFVGEKELCARYMTTKYSGNESLHFNIAFLFVANRFSNRNHILRNYVHMKSKLNKSIRMIDGWNTIHWPFWMRCTSVRPKPFENWAIWFQVSTVRVTLPPLASQINEKQLLFGTNTPANHYTMPSVNTFLCTYIWINLPQLLLIYVNFNIFGVNKLTMNSISPKLKFFKKKNTKLTTFFEIPAWNDARTEETVEKVLDKIPNRDKNYCKSLSGLPISPYFSALKLMWLKENVPEINQAFNNKSCLVGTIDSWLTWVSWIAISLRFDLFHIQNR